MIRRVAARIIMIDCPCQAIAGGNQGIIRLRRKRVDQGIKNEANLFRQIFDGDKNTNDFISGLFSCLAMIDLKRRTCNIQKTSRSITSGI
jgi:hypothetical protein